jgi:uncharacterized protein (TIGR02453 family)
MITKQTFNFLGELARNNEREWFQANKSRYDAAKAEIHAFAAALIGQISGFDTEVPADLDPKSCVMRIYRDIRFSKDKTPYKNNFGIGISQKGKSFAGPGYYVHVQPGKSFIAGGCWEPLPEQLKAIRQEIDYNGADWHDVIGAPDFVSSFGAPDEESALKVMPRGYPSDHPDIRYLKLKNFTASRQLPDKDLIGEQGLRNVADHLENLYPFMLFLRSAIS